MYQGVDFDADLAQAEAALKTAEETHGPDHIQVSYCLDNIARLLRSNGVRKLDAINMEARAKAIRIKTNSDDMAKLTRQQHEVSDAIRTASRRQQKDKSRSALVTACIVLVCTGVVAKLLLAPTPSEKKMTESVLKEVNKVLPSTIIKGYIDKGQQAVKEVEEANKKHNEQIDQYMQADNK